MSTVFEAEDGAGKRVALKLLNSSVVSAPGGRDRLRREVHMLQKVRGQYVAEVLDAESDEDEAFIVTELIDGPTLEQDVVDSGVYTEGDLTDLARQLERAVESIHEVGVLHRDLKPTNVMMSENGPVLIDFGIAQLDKDSRFTQAGSLSHTPGYCDPRVIRGDQPDEAADWWALAAVLAYAATGTAPFGEGNSHAISYRALTGSPDLEGLSPELAAAFTRALSPDPAARISIGELIAVIEDPSRGEYLVQEPVSYPVGAPGGIPKSGNIDDVVASLSSPETLVPDGIGEVGQFNATMDGYGRQGNQPDMATPTAVTPVGNYAGVGDARATVVGASGHGGVDPNGVLPLGAPDPREQSDAKPTEAIYPYPAEQGQLGNAQPYGRPVIAASDGYTPNSPNRDHFGPASGYQTVALDRYQPPEDMAHQPTQDMAYQSAQNADWAHLAPYAGVVHDPQIVPQWMRPAPPSRILVLLVGALLTCAAMLFPMVSVFAYFVLAVVASCIGSTSARLRRRRMERGGPSGSDAMFAALRLPWALVRSVILQILNTVVGAFFGAAAMWVASVFTLPSLRLVIAIGATVTFLVSWSIGSNASGQEGSRIACRALVPSPGYKVFWSFVLVMAIGVVALLAMGGQPNWVPVNAPFFLAS